MNFSLVLVTKGCSLPEMCSLLVEVDAPVACMGARGSWGVGLSSCGSRVLDTGSAVVVHGLGCSAACAVFPGQALSPPLLRWQVGSSPLSHQAEPPTFVFLTGTLSSLT